MIKRIHIENYRSVIDLEINLKRVNIVTGANGTGKSNVFKAVQLVQAAAEGRLGRLVRDEGGMSHLMHANEVHSKGVRTRVTVETEEFEYSIEMGTRPLSEAGFGYSGMFLGDPQIKAEKRKIGASVMVDRARGTVRLRDQQGKLQFFEEYLRDSESVMTQLSDPRDYGYLFAFRESVRRWRMYHEFRCDEGAPARVDRQVTKMPVLPADGSDLDSALVSVLCQEANQGSELQEAVSEAFDGAQVVVEPGFVGVQFSGMERAMRLRELSDGTLRFLCLAAALLAVEPPPVLVFNEPESSLNERMLPALAGLIVRASRGSQIWITTHSAVLADLVAREVETKRVALEMVEGRTRLEGWGESTVWRYED